MSHELKSDFYPFGDKILPVPYLSDNQPERVLEKGRQLFVDDYSVERRMCRRKWHEATPYIKAIPYWLQKRKWNWTRAYARSRRRSRRGVVRSSGSMLPLSK